MSAMNLADVFSQQAQRTPDAIAVRMPQRDLRFDELEQLVHQFARAMRRQGIDAGDIVALSFVDELGLIAAMLATARIGAIVLVVQDDALLRTGMPVDRVDHVSTAQDVVNSPLSATALSRLLALLRGHVPAGPRVA